jgi:hypothetical protein
VGDLVVTDLAELLEDLSGVAGVDEVLLRERLKRLRIEGDLHLLVRHRQAEDSERVGQVEIELGHWHRGKRHASLLGRPSLALGQPGSMRWVVVLGRRAAGPKDP